MALIKGSAAHWSGQIVALIPAHNEEDSIQHTISALQAQTVRRTGSSSSPITAPTATARLAPGSRGPR